MIKSIKKVFKSFQLLFNQTKEDVKPVEIVIPTPTKPKEKTLEDLIASSRRREPFKKGDHVYFKNDFNRLEVGTIFVVNEPNLEEEISYRIEYRSKMKSRAILERKHSEVSYSELPFKSKLVND